VAGTAASAIAIERRLGDDRLLVVVNAGTEGVDLDLAQIGLGDARFVPVYSDGGDSLEPIDLSDGVGRSAIPPRSGGVWRMTSR
jgi:hypothetical protein